MKSDQLSRAGSLWKNVYSYRRLLTTVLFSQLLLFVAPLQNLYARSCKDSISALLNARSGRILNSSDFSLSKLTDDLIALGYDSARARNLIETAMQKMNSSPLVDRAFNAMSRSGLNLDAQDDDIRNLFLRYFLTGEVADRNIQKGALDGMDPTNWFTHDFNHLLNIMEIHADSKSSYMDLMATLGFQENEIEDAFRASALALITHDSEMYLAHGANGKVGRKGHAAAGAVNVGLFGVEDLSKIGFSDLNDTNAISVILSMISEFHSKSASGALSDLNGLQKTLSENLDAAGVVLDPELLQKYTRIVAIGSYFEGASDVMRDRGSAAFAVPSGNRQFRLKSSVNEVEILDSGGSFQGQVNNFVIYAEKGLDVSRSIRKENGMAIVDFQLTDISPNKLLSELAADGSPTHEGVKILVHDLIEDHSRGYLTDPNMAQRLKINVFFNGRLVN